MANCIQFQIFAYNINFKYGLIFEVCNNKLLRDIRSYIIRDMCTYWHLPTNIDIEMITHHDIILIPDFDHLSISILNYAGIILMNPKFDHIHIKISISDDVIQYIRKYDTLLPITVTPYGIRHRVYIDIRYQDSVSRVIVYILNTYNITGQDVMNMAIQRILYIKNKILCPLRVTIEDIEFNPSITLKDLIETHHERIAHIMGKSELVFDVYVSALGG